MNLLLRVDLFFNNDTRKRVDAICRYAKEGESKRKEDVVDVVTAR
jgi:hypothetical protein